MKKMNEDDAPDDHNVYLHLFGMAIFQAVGEKFS